ncbi:hypothetical protein LFM09_14210 [Lentzea alba]|uniref:hypothetical protein n=1 Tax=Lentzea alba TaxID=2714351 RepID=UPI0039BF4333
MEPKCVAPAQLAGETFAPPPDAVHGVVKDAVHGVVKDDGTMARELIKGRNRLGELITALR